jgi:hypothetical protein
MVSTISFRYRRWRCRFVEAVLNHISGANAGVAGTYNRALFLEDKRAALNAYADHMARIIEDNHQ